MRSKKEHESVRHEREQIGRAAFFTIHLRRGPALVIHEEPFATLAEADARALVIEAANKPKPAMLYAVTPEGRAYLIPADMRLAARNERTKP